MALKSGRVGIHPSQVDPITGMLLAGPGGTTDYTQLTNKPQINNVTLSGNKSLSDLGIATSLSDLQDVTITDPQDGSYLIYDSVNHMWVNTTTPPVPVVPEGSTVTPTDDIQIWLACAGITDKSYTTLNEVLADSTTLLALMSDNNAVDYLVRSTTWANGITADSTAMTDIGANNYCANTLLDDATWCDAICNSTYFESVLNVKVPTMTSNTTPSGTASDSTESTANTAYKVFDNDLSTNWHAENNTSGRTKQWVEYEFSSAVTCWVAKLRGSYWNGQASRIKQYKIQAYSGSEWVDLTEVLTCPNEQEANGYTPLQVAPFTKNIASYTKHRLYVLDCWDANSISCPYLQFYGRQDI